MLLLVSVTSPSRSVADASSAFDTLEVGVLMLRDISNNEYHEYWQQAWGGEIFAQSPFYAGSIRLGARLLENAVASGADVPSSETFTLYLGWSLVDFGLIADRIFIDGGVALAMNRWDFDEEDNAGLQEEIEAAIEYYARLRYAIAGNWNINTSIHYQSTYTWHPINLTFVTFGVSRSLSMPGWLKGFLR